MNADVMHMDIEFEGEALVSRCKLNEACPRKKNIECTKCHSREVNFYHEVTAQMEKAAKLFRGWARVPVIVSQGYIRIGKDQYRGAVRLTQDMLLDNENYVEDVSDKLYTAGVKALEAVIGRLKRTNIDIEHWLNAPKVQVKLVFQRRQNTKISKNII